MPTRKQVLDLAKTQVGKTEYPPNSNNVKYNTDFYGHPVQDGVPTAKDKYPWCCTFIWLENPMDRGAWRATVYSVEKRQT